MQSQRGGAIPIAPVVSGRALVGSGGGYNRSNNTGEIYTASGGGSGNTRQVQGNPNGVSFGGYGRVSYSTTPGGGQSLSSGRVKAVVVRGEETRRPDTLNLDEFLAETNASDLRKLSAKKNGKL